MYIAISKIDNTSGIFKEKTTLARHIGMSIRNIYRKPDVNFWETDGYLIYKPDILVLKSKRGGNKSNLKRGNVIPSP